MSFVVDFAGSAAVGALGNIGVLTNNEIQGGTIGTILLPVISIFAVHESSGEVVLELGVPGGAVVTRAMVTVTASAPGATPVGGIATVRAAAGDPATSSDELVVDFGTLRTVSSVRVPAAAGSVSSVTPWVGTKFDGAQFFEGSSAWVDFTELQTERLLVTLADPLSPAALAADGVVTTTTPPADLELSVGATRVWIRPGPVPAGFSQEVDVTSAVQAAVDAGGVPDAQGNLRIRLVLRARVPGTLGLELPEPVRFLRTLTVDFPGPTTSLRFAEEGQRPVTLPLPAGSDGWTVHRIVVTVGVEDPGPLRVLPPVGPARSTLAELVLDPDRRLVARLPAGPLGRLPSIAGVRVSLRPGPAGLEVGGALLGGTASEPGDPLADAAFVPVSLPAAADRSWTTLALARPVEPPAEETVWASLSVTRGSAVLDLADPALVPPGDLAELRRIAPNGIAHPPSTALLPRPDPALPAVAVRTDALALRVIGQAADDAPIAVVDVDVPGGPTVREPAGPGAVSISLDPAGPRSPLELLVTTTAATTVTVGPVVVAYTEGATL